MIGAGKSEPEMPVSPGTWTELAGFGVGDDFSQYLVTNLIGETLHVRVVADVHHLGHHTLRHDQRFIGCLPPDILPGQMLQYPSLCLVHRALFNVVP